MISFELLLIFLLVIVPSTFQTHHSYRRVSYGTPPPTFSYPYTSQVTLESIDEKRQSASCSGTIISEFVVLSNAHCVSKKVEIKIGYGAFYWLDLIKVQARNWILHPDYLTYFIDIGLVIGRESLKLTPEIQPAHLQTWVTQVNVMKESMEPLVCGWGQDQNGKVDDLHCIFYNGVAHDKQCMFIPKMRKEHMWCFNRRPTSFGNKTYHQACHGDSGSGVFIKLNDNEWHLTGVLTQASGCGDEDGADTVTHLNETITDWIKVNANIGHSNHCAEYL